jgi:UDP-N-acetyl-2-amino-2-deoxyglucuronate dehydrogenase
VATKIGIGLVGCGTIAPHHLESILHIDNAELIATMDIDAERARDLAGRYGAAAWYADYDDVLNDRRIELVDLATPSGMHASQAIAACRAGKHVLVEEPMAVTLDQADAMIAAARDNRVMLSTVYQRRLRPGVVFLKQQVAAGRFGKLVVGNAYAKVFRTQSYYDGNGWRGTWEMDGGGALSNQASHIIDLLQWIAGPVESVYGQVATRSHRMEAEDVAVVLLKFGSGALGTIEASTGIYPGVADNPNVLYPGLPDRVEIFGESGSAVIQFPGIIAMWKIAGAADEEAEVLARFGTPAKPSYVGRFRSAYMTNAHRRLIEDCVQAIIEGREPQVTAQDGRRSLELVRAIYRSVATGAPVRLPLSGPDPWPCPAP